MSRVLEWLDACAWTEKYGPEPEVNIFYLDHDPAEAARAHCDKHVVKMVTETAQILSTVWQLVQPEALYQDWMSTDPRYPLLQCAPGDNPAGVVQLGRQRIYKKTHPHHPSCKWAAESTGNYDWLWRLGVELAAEYTYRYKRVHGALGVLYTLELPPPKLPEGIQTQPPPVMPEELTVANGDEYDTVASYRRLYVEAKQWLLHWTRREPPEWIEMRNGKWSLRVTAEAE